MQKDVVDRAREIYTSPQEPESAALKILPELVDEISTLRNPGEEIAAAFKKQIEARVTLFWAEEAVLERKIALKKKESELMLSGAIIGKNAETRDAQLKEGCKDEIASLEKAEYERRATQLSYELSQMTVESLKWLIRAEGKEL